MSRSSAIPATASADFSLAPSRWQRRWLVLGHLLVPLLFLPNRPPWLLFVLICLLLAVHGYWQWRRQGQRSGVLEVDSRGLHINVGDGDPVPVTCETRYLSRWLLVLDLASALGRQRLALWRDGYPPEQWRRLQILARGQLRTGNP